MNTKRHKQASGFTLVEILIVVIILGILAAIVIPQFTNASTSARYSNLTSQLQTVRSQVSLYKVQHNDDFPVTDGTLDWTKLTTKTDAEGAAYVEGSSKTGPFGPYLQAEPTNPLNGKSKVGSTPAADIGWVFDSDTGKIWATDKSMLNYFNEVEPGTPLEKAPGTSTGTED